MATAKGRCIGCGAEATEDSGQRGKAAVLTGSGRVFGTYRTVRGQELWAITDLRAGTGTTTLLLPREY